MLLHLKHLSVPRESKTGQFWHLLFWQTGQIWQLFLRITAKFSPIFKILSQAASTVHVYCINPPDLKCIASRYTG